MEAKTPVDDKSKNNDALQKYKDALKEEQRRNGIIKAIVIVLLCAAAAVGGGVFAYRKATSVSYRELYEDCVSDALERNDETTGVIYSTSMYTLVDVTGDGISDLIVFVGYSKHAGSFYVYSYDKEESRLLGIVENQGYYIVNDDMVLPMDEFAAYLEGFAWIGEDGVNTVLTYCSCADGKTEIVHYDYVDFQDSLEDYLTDIRRPDQWAETDDMSVLNNAGRLSRK